MSYNAGDFTASAGNWTVDAGDFTQYSYLLIGKTMFINFRFDATDLSAAPVSLSVTIPAGKTAAKRVDFPIVIANAGLAGMGMGNVAAGGTKINFFTNIAGTAWTTTAADNTGVAGFCAIETT